MGCLRYPIASWCEAILDDGYEVADLGIVGDTREKLLADAVQLHHETVIFEESCRRASHDCPDAKYRDDPLPICNAKSCI